MATNRYIAATASQRVQVTVERSQALTPTEPVAVLTIKVTGSIPEVSEPIYGGYSNGRGEIVLFGRNLAYRVNVKRQTLQERPRLNEGAQLRYDATDVGDAFEYGRKPFRRLSHEQISEICSSGQFRLTSKCYGAH